jgi:F0F1-type ATP synthase gamma subunit
MPVSFKWLFRIYSILDEMIDKLTLQFNRTRQAVITRELIEIISGASCV